MAARGEPTCWADVQDEEDRLANTPADLLEPLIPLPNSSSSQAFQNALEDPLGVAPAKSMDAALTRARAPDATFTAGSISLSSADFNPITFLAEVHRDTKLEDLIAGMATLNATVASQTTQMKTLAQENFDQFVLCKDTVDEIAAEIRKVEGSADGTAELEKEVSMLHSKAQSFFSPLLEQKAQGDRARRHLEALKRYDFLLRLPRAIDEHAAKGEYEQVVASYSRARNLLNGKATTRRTKVVIRILSEVEERIGALRGRLYRKLDAAELPKEEAKRLIRVLSELDAQPDPAEYYLSKQRAHVTRLLLAVKISTTSPAKSIKKLRTIYSTHATDLWRLAVSLTASDAKRKEQFTALITELTQIFAQQVRATISANKKQQQAAVREAVTELAMSTVAATEGMLPASIVDIVQKLRIEIVQSLVAELAAQTKRDAGLLYLEQDWRTGLHGTTSMPSEFALLYRETLAQLRAVVPTDNEALERQGAATLIDAARAFCDSLHQSGIAQRLAGVSTSSIIRLQTDEQVLSVSPCKQMLLILADCIYTRTTLLPDLTKAATKLLPKATADLQKGLEDLSETLKHLESLVTAKYLRAHAADVRRALIDGFGASDWLSAEEPQGVSPFILRALLVIAGASADVAAVVPALHVQVISALVEAMLQSLTDAVVSTDDASAKGALQLDVDVAVTQTALSRFRTPASEAWLAQLSSAVRHLQPKGRTSEEKEQREKLVASVLAKCTAVLDSLRPRT